MLVSASPAPTATPTSVPPVGPCRVLVADDNRDAAEALTLLLQITGYEVVTAHTGNEALEVAKQTRPHACILDIGMPGLSGYDVACALRSQSWGRDVLLVAVTGWGQSQDVERAMAAGFDRHFTKPVDPGTIEQVLADFSRATAGRGHPADQAAG